MGGSAAETIFAVSSGQVPAGIAVLRISGPAAGDALVALARTLPEPRHAALRQLRDAAGETLDQALILWLPGPGTSTGEDVAELHLHGSRAVVAAVSAALGALPGLRPAEPGEFTRRAFFNGRIDLAQAEGLADLLAAETDGQRRQALRLAEGGLGRLIGGWREATIHLAARIEAALEFAEDDDAVPADDPALVDDIGTVRAAIAAALQRPPAERLRDGVRVVVAGPPNSGKSSLINILAGRDMALVSPLAGTTRDLIEAAVQIDDVPLLLIDSAGLRAADDEIEQMGIARAEAAIAAADIVLWLGTEPPPPLPSLICLHSRCDIDPPPDHAVDVAVSVADGSGLARLRALLMTQAREMLPARGDIALNARHRLLLGDVAASLEEAEAAVDPILRAEQLRRSISLLSGVTGGHTIEAVFDALFSRFCLGK